MRLHINRQEMQAIFLKMLPCKIGVVAVGAKPPEKFSHGGGFCLFGRPTVFHTLTNPGVFRVPEEMKPIYSVWK